MSELVRSTPDLMTTKMTKEEVDQAFRDLKKHAISYQDHQKDIAFHHKMSEQDRAAAGELAFRLKENDNWKLRDGGYRSWAECCMNEFGGAIRQEVDRLAAEYQVARIVPKELGVKPGLQSRALAQVPDDMKIEVMKAAKKAAPINKKTGLRQMSARVIAEVAAEKGVDVRGMPTAAKPRAATVRFDKPTGADALSLLRGELVSIRNRGLQFQAATWGDTDEELHAIRAFINTLVLVITEKLAAAA